MRQGETVTIPVVVTINDEGFEQSTPRLNGWIDWNGNGIFEAGERIATNLLIGTSGTVNLSVTVPVDAITTQPTFARFRIGPSVTGPTGLASFGEVEDYQIQILVPTAVDLSFFEAEPMEDRIVVTWETVSELDNQGFNLYRALEINGEQTLLGWIPSSAPGTTQGQIYKHRDFDVLAGQTYWYWLEDVDLYGVATRHGPVSATFGATLSRKTFLPMLQVR